MNLIQIFIGIMLMALLSMKSSGEEEQVGLWIFPATEQMADALNRIQDEKKLALHEVLNGHGFGVKKNNIWLNKNESGEWRLEYSSVQINAHVLMMTLHRYQHRCPGDPGMGMTKTEEEIYEMLIKHVDSQEFRHSLRIHREYEKRLKIFNSNWMDNWKDEIESKSEESQEAE